jgi:hypothetical protein
MAKLIAAANAQGLYNTGCCMTMPITKAIANNADAYKKYRFIFMPWVAPKAIHI